MLFVALSLGSAPAAIAQTDSAAVARVLRRASAQLDSARKSPKVAANTLLSAEVTYGAAVELQRLRHYNAASQLAARATNFAESAGRGISEFGPEPDTIPFGVERVPPSVPPIKPDSQARGYR